MTPPAAVSLMPLENRRETVVQLATAVERRGYAALFLSVTPNPTPARIHFALEALF